MAQMLINLLPTFPPEAPVAEAAQHISNLILDKDYNRVLPLLKNPNLSEEVQDVLVTDLMNREGFREAARAARHRQNSKSSLSRRSADRSPDLRWAGSGRPIGVEMGRGREVAIKQQAADANAQ